MTLAPDSRLGVYQIVSPLGAGGMGEVYRARDTKLGREVAIKILPASFASDPDRLARFEREARLLASLNHPNIGAIHGVEETAGVVALVLELVDGETLADRLSVRRILSDPPGMPGPKGPGLPAIGPRIRALAWTHDGTALIVGKHDGTSDIVLMDHSK